MQKLTALIRLGRLHFLAGGVVLHLLGAAVALFNGAKLNPDALIWGQIAITAIQLMTHYSNDYFDLEADRANRTPTRWSGGSRVLPDDQLSPRIALIVALAAMLVALAAVYILFIHIGTGIIALPLIVLALALSWAYSAPPFRLHSRGIGEVTVAVVVPGLTPLVGYALQAGRMDTLPVLAIIPLCCLQFAMLLTIEFPDAEGDASVGKRTLVVRAGAKRAAEMAQVAILLAYGSFPVLVSVGLPPLIGLMVPAILPLAFWQLRCLSSGAWERPKDWNRLGFTAIALLIGTAALELVGFALLIGLD